MPYVTLSRIDLTPSTKLVYMAISGRMGNHTTAWPSVSRIAMDCGLAHRSVLYALNQLETLGLITVFRKAGTANRYEICTSAETAPVQNLHRGSAKIALEVVQNLHPELDKRTRSKNYTKKSAKVDPWAVAQTAMTEDTLKTEDFRAAWQSWTEYRRQVRKPLTAATIERQVRKLEGYGHDGAIASIERSIEHGWQGLFPPENEQGRDGLPNAARSRRDEGAPPTRPGGVRVKPGEYPEPDLCL